MFIVSKLFRFLYLILLSCSWYACAQQEYFMAKGTVSAIERGKDGYTAILTTKKGPQVNAVVSRVNMVNTQEYQQLAVGDKVTVYGDSTRLGEVISVKVKRIKK
jgi:uncharacterized protein YdbL (DUF1318 family)